MFETINFLKLQTTEDIKKIYTVLQKDLLKYNNSFFHFDNEKMNKILVSGKLTEDDYLQFKQNWENFNTHKHILTHFFKNNKINYPKIFDEHKRICIDEITINYDKILNELNTLRINNLPVPYVYSQIISKLIKNLFISKILKSTEKLIDLNINFKTNKILLIFNNLKNNKEYNKEYKLNKFLLKYQNKYPEYKYFKSWLIISADWKDIFLSSTFKQWTSCMNMINSYSDVLVKYSNENYVRSRSDWFHI